MAAARVAIPPADRAMDPSPIPDVHLDADALFLRSACPRSGVWSSPPGEGIRHPVHGQSFGKPEPEDGRRADAPGMSATGGAIS
jgi:hypothetical protein